MLENQPFKKARFLHSWSLTELLPILEPENSRVGDYELRNIGRSTDFEGARIAKYAVRRV